MKDQSIQSTYQGLLFIFAIIPNSVLRLVLGIVRHSKKTVNALKSNE